MYIHGKYKKCSIALCAVRLCKQFNFIAFFIQKGAGIDGGSRLDTLLAPDFLLSQDNIVVHLEYRVLLLGFLNLGFGEYTGNMGVKDQQMGLRWIYENIEQFSGKKDEIMIFGGSAGTFLALQKSFD